MLEAQFQNKWLDPADFATIEEFHKAYTEVQQRAMAYKEVVTFLEGAEQMIMNLRKQIKSPDKNYEL